MKVYALVKSHIDDYEVHHTTVSADTNIRRLLKSQLIDEPLVTSKERLDLRFDDYFYIETYIDGKLLT